MADPSPTPQEEAAAKARAQKIGWGCALALAGLFGTCLAIPHCPAPRGPNCGRQYAVWDAAEDRREALEERARSAIGLERTLVLQELAEAQTLEAQAERAWRACTGR